jgi:hypothetical protein
MESIIRLLIRDFKIAPGPELTMNDLSVLLDTTEQAFMVGYGHKSNLIDSITNFIHGKG